MSFEPRVEARSLEASYNLTAQLRLEMVERRREEEVSTTTNKQVYFIKGESESEERKGGERKR